jgi:hypothetical protein
MQMKIKAMLIASVAAFILTMPLAAQNYNTSGGGAAPTFSSNQKRATATLFNTDVDDFINYHNYSKVNPQNGFGFITGTYGAVGGNQQTGFLNAGFARDFGSVYLGMRFNGNIFQNTDDGSETINLLPDYDNNTQQLLSTTKTTAYAAGWLNSTNQIEFLIGVAGHGIKLGFYESLFNNEHKGSTARNATVQDLQNGVVNFTNAVGEFTQNGGILKPYLGWGTKIPIGGGMDLFPYVDFAFDIYGNTLIDNFLDYTEVNGKKTSETTTVGTGHNNGYFRPVGKIGAKVNLEKRNTVQTTLELSYRIDTYIYNSDYEATGLSGDAVKGYVSWNSGYVNRTTRTPTSTTKTTNLTLSFDERTNIHHTITPNYKITGEPASGLKLGFIAEIPFTFGSSSSSAWTEDYTSSSTEYLDGSRTTNSRTIKTYGANTETTDVDVTLNLRLGASYKLIPDRFTINAGIYATPARFFHQEVRTLPNNVNSTDRTTSTVDGEVTSDQLTVNRNNGQADNLVTSNQWNGFRGSLSGGLMFNFTPNMALDMSVSAGGSNLNFDLDLSSVNVLFSIKF